ncbi:hypothetical protein OHV05_24635 [Kitasatospora sp. NBC_00070]|uniref:hypothetical protein n=1 Tax=Kitasatospora sp. NBC_00070 TaxID=2975962 RepID=UPI0032467800
MPTRRPRPPRMAVRITLTCGCTILARNQPLGSRTTFGCTTGQGHGYSLAWTSYEDTDSGCTSLRPTP